MFSTTELIKDLYELEVTCNISIEELADDIMEDIKKSYNQALEDAFNKLEKYEDEDGWLRIKMSSIFYILGLDK